MRALLLLGITVALAGVALADVTPPAPPAPKPRDAEWRRINRAITSYCSAAPSDDCTCFLDTLHRRPTSLRAEWQHDGTLELYEDVDDAVIDAKLRKTKSVWSVLAVACGGIGKPNF